MRSALYSKADFLLKMKNKKPALQAILDNFDSYTKEELTNMAGQPLWVREALVELYKRGELILSAAKAEKIADAMEVPEGYGDNSKNRTFEVRRWTTSPDFVGSGIQGNFQISIELDDLILILDEESALRVNSTMIPINSHDLIKVMYNSEPVGWMTAEEYFKANQERLNKKHGIVPEPIAPDGFDQSPPEGKKYGINPNQIERPGVRYGK